MTVVSAEVAQYFADGVRTWERGSLPTARGNFEWAIHLDERATDAWRALAATEDGMEAPATPEQIAKIWEHRAYYGELLTAVRRPVDAVAGKFSTGLWGIDWKLCTKSDIALAYAFLLLEQGKYDEVEGVLEQANANIPFTHIAHAALHYRTQRWGDVIAHCDKAASAQRYSHNDKLIEPVESDSLVQALSSLMAGEALAHLERHSAAVKRLTTAMDLTHAPISAHAAYVAGLSQRALGDEKESERLLSFALSRSSESYIAKAADSKTLLLDTTSEALIAQRTSYWDKSTEPSLASVRAETAESARETLLREADEELNSFIGMGSVKHQIKKLKSKTIAAQARKQHGLAVESVNQHIIFTGPPGCIQGDAMIALNRAGKGFQMKLRDVVRKFNGEETRRDWAGDNSIPTYVQREVDGVVRLAKLENAWFSGVKTTYTVTTDSGRQIRATDEHPFLTERGWLRLDELVPGDSVHVRGARSSTGRKSKPRYRTVCVVNHPYSGSRNRVPEHRLVAEATMNGMKYEDFLFTVRNGNMTGLEFLDPAALVVHHVDLDSTNNKPDNLQVLTHAEHHRLHAALGDENNVQLLVATESVVSVEKYGDEETFDIEVADDPHNFLANGFVVHNTGKTTIARVVGKLYAGLGITAEEKVIETARPDFVGDTVGSTGLKTRKVINEALGGVLFIDEAYALVQETGANQTADSFGKEALDVLVAEMENNRDNLVVIMAGYNRDIERLLATNEGLKSRFSRKIEFDSYTPEEIWLIAQQMANKRGAILDPNIEELLVEQVRDVLMTRNHEGKTLLDIAGNGRFVRNVVEGSEEERDLRLMDVATERGVDMAELSPEELTTITVDDVSLTLDRLMKEYL